MGLTVEPRIDDVVERIRLVPDAGLVESLGANHTLESAVADLLDNSIDAGATKAACDCSPGRTDSSRSRCSTTGAAWTRRASRGR